MADIESIKAEIEKIKAHAQAASVDLMAEEPDARAQAYQKMIAERQAIINYHEDETRHHLEALEAELFPQPTTEPDVEDPNAVDPLLN